MKAPKLSVLLLLCFLCGILVSWPWIFGDGASQKRVEYVGDGVSYRVGAVGETVAEDELTQREQAVFDKAIDEGAVRVSNTGMWQRGSTYYVMQDNTVHKFQVVPVLPFARFRLFFGPMFFLTAGLLGCVIGVRSFNTLTRWVRLRPPR